MGWSKFKDLLAAYDWYLYLKESDDQVLRFGTVTTQWEDMGGYQDYCFISTIFSGDKSRPFKWVQNLAVAASVLKLHQITPLVGKAGSSFPYVKAMRIVAKSDLSISDHREMHDYMHTMGIMMGNSRSCNSKLVSTGITRTDV